MGELITLRTVRQRVADTLKKVKEEGIMYKVNDQDQDFHFYKDNEADSLAVAQTTITGEILHIDHVSEEEFKEILTHLLRM